MEKQPTSSPGISPTTITFPDPPAAAFSIARAANHGCPQVGSRAHPQRPAGGPAASIPLGNGFRGKAML